jgi:hypothetical protein
VPRYVKYSRKALVGSVSLSIRCIGMSNYPFNQNICLSWVILSYKIKSSIQSSKNNQYCEKEIIEFDLSINASILITEHPTNEVPSNNKEHPQNNCMMTELGS